MVCLSPNHPVMEEDIVGVDFFHDCRINLSGKMKNELLKMNYLDTCTHSIIYAEHILEMCAFTAVCMWM